MKRNDIHKILYNEQKDDMADSVDLDKEIHEWMNLSTLKKEFERFSIESNDLWQIYKRSNINQYHQRLNHRLLSLIFEDCHVNEKDFTIMNQKDFEFLLNFAIKANFNQIKVQDFDSEQQLEFNQLISEIYEISYDHLQETVFVRRENECILLVGDTKLNDFYNAEPLKYFLEFLFIKIDLRENKMNMLQSFKNAFYN